MAAHDKLFLSRRFSFFGLGGPTPNVDSPLQAPQVKLLADRQVYRPGDLMTITIEIKNPMESHSLLIESLSFGCTGIEKLDTQWFKTASTATDHSKLRRGEYVFMECYIMECSTPAIVSNQMLSAGAVKSYMVRTILPNSIPPSYRGTAIRYLYYVRSTLSGQYLILENGPSCGKPILHFSEMEA